MSDVYSWDIANMSDRRLLSAQARKRAEARTLDPDAVLSEDRQNLPLWLKNFYKGVPRVDDFHDRVHKQMTLFWRDSFLQMEKLSPMTILDQQTKEQFKRKLKQNAPKLVGVAASAALYCSAFHEAKRGLKYITRNRRRIGPCVGYVCDVMLPTGLYGPLFGVLLRLTLPF